LLSSIFYGFFNRFSTRITHSHYFLLSTAILIEKTATTPPVSAAFTANDIEQRLQQETHSSPYAEEVLLTKPEAQSDANVYNQDPDVFEIPTGSQAAANNDRVIVIKVENVDMKEATGATNAQDRIIKIEEIDEHSDFGHLTAEEFVQQSNKNNTLTATLLAVQNHQELSNGHSKQVICLATSPQKGIASELATIQAWRINDKVRFTMIQSNK